MPNVDRVLVAGRIAHRRSGARRPRCSFLLCTSFLPRPLTRRIAAAGQSLAAGRQNIAPASARAFNHRRTKDAKADIGLIGLGVMGSNLALNIAEKGHRIAVFNRTTARTSAFVAGGGQPCGAASCPATTIEALAAAIRPPRPIILMVQAGKRGRRADRAAAPACCPTATSSSMPATPISATRCAASPSLTGTGLTFIGMGVSGGEEGARHGPSIMVGGTAASYDRVEPVLTAIAAKYEGEPCCGLARHGRRRPFRQDHPQRHRICRHADDRRDLRRPARRARHERRSRSADVFERLEQRPAQLLPDRDHRQRCSPPTTRRPASRWSTSSSTGPARRAPADGRPSRRRRSAFRRPRSRRRSPPAVLSAMKASARPPKRAYGEAARRGSCRDERDATARRSGAGAVRRQDRRLCAGLRGDGRRLEGVRLGPAAADDRQDLAGRLHHPLAVPRHDRRGLRGRRSARQPADGAGLRRHDEGGRRARRCAAPWRAPSAPGCRCRRWQRRWPISTATGRRAAPPT